MNTKSSLHKRIISALVNAPKTALQELCKQVTSDEREQIKRIAAALGITLDL